MRIRLNGSEREAEAGWTVGDLLRDLGVPPFGTAVEVNGVILEGEARGNQRLAEGDLVEVVRVVGGGQI